MATLSDHNIRAHIPPLEHVPPYLAGVLALVIFIATIAAYNLFFHPLRKYPGPILARATGLVWCYNTFTGNEASWTRYCHDKYGEVVRLGPDKLSYTHPQAWKDIYGHRIRGRQENFKDPRIKMGDGSKENSVLTIRDPQAHGRVRKIFTNAFSDKALKLQEPLVVTHVNKLIRNMAKAVSENPDVHLPIVKLYNCTTFDIMGDLAFGEPLGMLDTGEYTAWVKAVFAGIKYGNIFRVAREYPLIERILTALLPRSANKAREIHFNHTVERVDRRLEKGNDPSKADIWRLVLDKGNDMLGIDEMHSNASLMMIAGTETTATLLSGLTYYLLKNPEKMQKVVEEVRALSEEQLTFEVLPRLPYMNACFEEGLRCYPPVPIGLNRVIPKGGNSIVNEWIPAGTRVSVAHLSAYRSPLNFKNPEAFEPERWLPNTGYDDDRKEALQPFSTGPRNCLGKNLAYHEMQSILASVLWRFDLELCPESDGWANQKVFGLWDKPELWIKAKPVRR